MRKNDDKKNLTQSFAFSVGIGAVVGFLSILLLFAIFAAIITSGKLSDNLMSVLTVLNAFIGAVIGAFVAAKRMKIKIMTVSLCVGTAMFVITLIGSAFSESGSLIGKLTPFLFAALILGGIIGGLLNIKRKKRKHA